MVIFSAVAQTATRVTRANRIGMSRNSRWLGRQENSEIQRRYAAILDSNGGDRDQTYQQYWQKVGMPRLRSEET